MNISEKIKSRRLELGLSLEDVAKELGVNRSTVLRYESDAIKKMPIDVIMPLSKVLKCSPEYLMGWDETEQIKMPVAEPMQDIYIYNPVSCGNGMFVDENIITVVALPKSMLPKGKKDLFGQYASGDSMINKNINDGDLLIFNKEQCESGDVGCFCIDENIATCKTLRIVNETIMLMPANDKYEPIVVDVDKFMCVGKLVLVVSKV